MNGNISEKNIYARRALYLFGALFLITAGPYMIRFCATGFSTNSQDWGGFGSYIGGTLGTAATISTLIFLYWSFTQERSQQREQIDLLRIQVDSEQRARQQELVLGQVDSIIGVIQSSVEDAVVSGVLVVDFYKKLEKILRNGKNDQTRGVIQPQEFEELKRGEPTISFLLNLEKAYHSLMFDDRYKQLVKSGTDSDVKNFLIKKREYLAGHGIVDVKEYLVGKDELEGFAQLGQIRNAMPYLLTHLNEALKLGIAPFALTHKCAYIYDCVGLLVRWGVVDKVVKIKLDVINSLAPKDIGTLTFKRESVLLKELTEAFDQDLTIKDVSFVEEVPMGFKGYEWFMATVLRNTTTGELLVRIGFEQWVKFSREDLKLVPTNENDPLRFVKKKDDKQMELSLFFITLLLKKE